MAESIYIGACPICQGYGMLEVVISEQNNDCSIMCDECFVQWKNPEDALRNVKGYRDMTSGNIMRSATTDEVKTVNWERYITNQ